jgi:ATP-dependent DNA ligase
LEGIVAKQKVGPYITEREHSTWFKIRNREYSQMVGREELFERDRHSEPVALMVRSTWEEFGARITTGSLPTAHVQGKDLKLCALAQSL